MGADCKVVMFDAIVCCGLDGLNRQPRRLEDWIDAAELRGLALVTADGDADLCIDGGDTYPRIKAAVASAEMERAAETSAANYAFYFGGSDDNADEIRRLDPTHVPGLKLFLGSSTGNGAMNADTVRRIFGETDLPIAVHAEEESIIERNRERYINLMGEDLPPAFHTKIRNAEACYASSSRVVELADKMGVRLPIAWRHISGGR